MNQIISLGRWLFIVPFVIFGLLHFGPLEFSLPFVPRWLPFPAVWVYGVGVCFLLFGVSTMMRKYDKLAAFLLACCLFLFVVLVHVPASFSGDFKSIIASLRDLCMCGAALIYADTVATDHRLIG
jgi:uncharacterized membrane protein